MLPKIRLLPDMKHLTKFCHTGQLEVCYLVVNRFYSKRLHFSGNGALARNKLPILDHNSGMDFDYAKTKAGQETFKLVFSKATKKIGQQKKIISSKSKMYLSELMQEAVQMKRENVILKSPSPPDIPSYVASAEKSDKQQNTL